MRGITLKQACWINTDVLIGLDVNLLFSYTVKIIWNDNNKTFCSNLTNITQKRFDSYKNLVNIYF